MTTSQALDRKSQADIAGVRAWISRHLDPLDAAASTTTPFRSDYDLKASPPPRQGSVTPAAVLIALTVSLSWAIWQLEGRGHRWTQGRDS